LAGQPRQSGDGQGYTETRETFAEPTIAFHNLFLSLFFVSDG